MIILKALEKDRNRRYGSPSDLAADIGRICATSRSRRIPRVLRIASLNTGAAIAWVWP